MGPSESFVAISESSESCSLILSQSCSVGLSESSVSPSVSSESCSMVLSQICPVCPSESSVAPSGSAESYSAVLSRNCSVGPSESSVAPSGNSESSSVVLSRNCFVGPYESSVAPSVFENQISTSEEAQNRSTAILIIKIFLGEAPKIPQRDGETPSRAFPRLVPTLLENAYGVHARLRRAYNLFFFGYAHGGCHFFITNNFFF